MDLSPPQAFLLAATLAAAAIVLRRRTGRWQLVVAAAREASIVAALYGLWQVVGRLSVMNASHAFDRGQSIWRFEQSHWFPSELAMQRWTLGHPLLIQGANIYYATVHGVALLAFLVWLFARHRTRYPAQRNVIALVTGGCLAIQFIPVAPPRMLTSIGFVDSGALYHQSVYGAVGHGMSDQFSAMPSVHVAWAVLIGFGVVIVGRSRWRWLALAHPIITSLVIVVTANHFWLDGVVALATIPLALLVLFAARRVAAVVRALVATGERREPSLAPPGAAPVLVDLALAETGEQFVGGEGAGAFPAAGELVRDPLQ